MESLTSLTMMMLMLMMMTLSCFVQLKSVLLNLLCVFDVCDETASPSFLPLLSAPLCFQPRTHISCQAWRSHAN